MIKCLMGSPVSCDDPHLQTDVARLRHPSQSLQLDRVRGQACAHLGQSCSIRATNHARRWPPGPKFRRTRLPPLLHNVLTRVAFCARFVSTPTAAPSCLPWQASRPSVACLFGEFLMPTVHTTHDPMVLIHWQLHANTALCSCVASATLCVSPLFLPFGSNFKCSKRSKTR